MVFQKGNELMASGKKRYRPDKDGTHRAALEKNKKKIYATQQICGICGRPVEKEDGKFKYKFPHPLSPCIDHIIPIDKGGHPSDISNLQLAHLCCNREKSDKIFRAEKNESEEVLDNNNLPLTFDWMHFRDDMGA